MRVEPRDADARLGNAEPRAQPVALTTLTVRTIRSCVMSEGTSLSGTWMVSGTARSSLCASIMTGSGVTPFCAQSAARNSVWPG
jgi:hypothetical protein